MESHFFLFLGWVEFQLDSSDYLIGPSVSTLHDLFLNFEFGLDLKRNEPPTVHTGRSDDGIRPSPFPSSSRESSATMQVFTSHKSAITTSKK
jgi:hypothetical protein